MVRTGHVLLLASHQDLYGFTQRLVKYSIFIRNVILTIQRAEELWDGSAERLGYRLVARMRNMNEIVERESYMYVDLFQALAD